MPNRPCSPAIVFAWVGTILINVAFGTLIVWGSITSWPVGFVLSFIYTIILFTLVRYLERKFIKDGNNDQEEPGGRHPIHILVCLLYALGVSAIGVTGLIIPLNLYYCQQSSGIDGGYDNPQIMSNYHTNASDFPPEVREWYEEGGYNYARASFTYMSESGTTLFRGADGNETDIYGNTVYRLWKVGGNHSSSSSLNSFYDGPELHSELYEPDELTFVFGDTVCFIAHHRYNDTRRDMSLQPPEKADFVKEDAVACTDGSEVRNTTDELNNPRNLFASNGMLWFRARAPNSSIWEEVVYSLDPDTMEQALRSRWIGDDSSDETDYSSCDWVYIRRQRGFVSIFSSILPALIASVLIWKKWDVPTMPITTYISLSGLVTALKLTIDPSTDDIVTLWKWWFALSSTLWLSVLLLLYLTNRVKTVTFAWNLNVSGIVFFVSMMILVGVPGTHDDWWRWILINLICYLPLVFVGVVTEFVLLTVFGAVGLFIDVWRIAQLISSQVGGNAVIPIMFTVFAVSGIGIGFAGWVLNRNQQRIQASVSVWAGKWLSWLMRREEEREEEGGRREEEEQSQSDEDTVAETEIETGVELSDTRSQIEDVDGQVIEYKGS